MNELKIKNLAEQQIASEIEAWIEILHHELSKRFQSRKKLNFESNRLGKPRLPSLKLFLGGIVNAAGSRTDVHTF